MPKYLPYFLRWGDKCNDTASNTISCEAVSPSREQEDPEARQIVSNLLRLYTKLCSFSDLIPCDTTNAVFEELVDQCTQALSQRIASKVC